MIYAGIGSRSTPDAIIDKMIALGKHMAHQGHLLRSGAADGADRAFEHGCDLGGGEKEIWLPWRNFNGSSSTLIVAQLPMPVVEKAKAIAASVHPAWDRCSNAAKYLHARNVFQILGRDFETPADKVICWTPRGEYVGGTATAMRLADEHHIEIVKLGDVMVA